MTVTFHLQVRSHAQKHFIRLEKKGLGDVVPPARRKARWADKRSAGLCDSLSESEQDFSALHQQASSSSVSTADHQAMLAAGHSLEGQPLSCRMDLLYHPSKQLLGGHAYVLYVFRCPICPAYNVLLNKHKADCHKTTVLPSILSTLIVSAP